MMGGCRHRGQGGFTLVEMLLSLALLSLVFSVFGGLMLRLGRTGTIVSTLEAAENVGLVRRFVAARLEGGRTMLSPAGSGQRLARFAGEAHRVTFAGVSAGEHEVGGLYETTLALDDAGQLLLFRRPLGWGGGTPAPPRVLLRGVASLGFRYHPCPGRTGSPGQQRWTMQDHLPYRITMDLAFRTGDPRVWPSLTVFPAASACAFRS